MYIRNAILPDAAAIASIYNDEVLFGVATFDTEPKDTYNREEWLLQHSDNYPVLVAEINNEVVGYASLSRWSERAAYNHTAELSVYIAKSHRAKGIGKKLIQAILDAGRQAQLHTILSRITEGNETSIYLHQQFGFETIGIMKQVGRKFDRYLDVVIMQKMI
jgi:L-amino acid N-acyltransferase